MTADLISLLASLHVLGAALGAGAITFAEYFYLEASRDGKMDECEKRYLRATFWGLRFGMTTVLFSGLFIIGLSFAMPEPPAAVFSPTFWFQHALTLWILFLGWALSRKVVAWWFGSAAALSAWWAILFLHSWTTTASPSYLTLFFAYGIGVFLVAGALALVRGFVIPNQN